MESRNQKGIQPELGHQVQRQGNANSADLQMRHQKLFTLARHLSVGHFE